MNLISMIRDAFCCGGNQDMDDDDCQSLQNEEAAVISSEPSMVVLIWRSESDNIWEREAQSVHLENLSSVNGNDVKFYFSDDSGDEQHNHKEETHSSNVTINGGNLLPAQDIGNQISAIDPDLKLEALEDKNKTTSEEKVHADVKIDQPEIENKKKTTKMVEELHADKKPTSNLDSMPVNSHVKNAVHRFETQFNANKGSTQQLRRNASGLGGKYNSLAENKLSSYATDVIVTHPVLCEEHTPNNVIGSTEVVPLTQVPLPDDVSAIETGHITDEAEKPTTSSKPKSEILPGASTDNVFMQYDKAETFNSTGLKDTDECEGHKDENATKNE